MWKLQEQTEEILQLCT